MDDLFTSQTAPEDFTPEDSAVNSASAMPDDTGVAMPIKRGRGRPRKYPLPDGSMPVAATPPVAGLVTANTGTLDGGAAVKRGRGRPRKYPLPTEAALPAASRPIELREVPASQSFTAAPPLDHPVTVASMVETPLNAPVVAPAPQVPLQSPMLPQVTLAQIPALPVQQTAPVPEITAVPEPDSAPLEELVDTGDELTLDDDWADSASPVSSIDRTGEIKVEVKPTAEPPLKWEAKPETPIAAAKVSFNSGESDWNKEDTPLFTVSRFAEPSPVDTAAPKRPEPTAATLAVNRALPDAGDCSKEIRPDFQFAKSVQSVPKNAPPMRETPAAMDGINNSKQIIFKHTEKPLELKNYGACLRSLREENGLSLRALAERTKINVNYLQALESEDRTHLPPPVYITAYLRKLGSTYSLTEEEIRQLTSFVKGALPAPAKPEALTHSPIDEPPRCSENEIKLRKIIIAAVAGAIIIIAVIVGVVLLLSGNNDRNQRVGSTLTPQVKSTIPQFNAAQLETFGAEPQIKMASLPSK